MRSDWEYAIKFLVTVVVLTAIAVLVDYFFSIHLAMLIYLVVSLIGLWRQRKQLPSIVNRAKVIIAIVFMTALSFGFLIWYIYGDSGLSLGLVLTTVVVIVMAVGLYGHEISNMRQAEASILAEDEMLSEEERQVCPNCRAIISQGATWCPWCGESI